MKNITGIAALLMCDAAQEGENYVQNRISNKLDGRKSE